MSKNKQIYLTLCIVTFVMMANADLTFNSDKCQTQKYDSWDALYCPCSGGSGDYQYQYSKLPQGWYANKDRVYIPKGKIQSNKFYSTKVTVYDRNNRQNIVKRSLLYNYGADNRIGKFHDADYQTDFQDRIVLDQFVNNKIRYGYGGGDNRDRDYDSRVRNQIVNNQVNRVVIGQRFQPAANYGNTFVPNQVVGNTFVPNQIVVPNQYIPSPVIDRRDQRREERRDDRRNPYYNTFPIDEQVQRILSSSDTSKIRQTIDYIVQSGFQCKERSRFLQKLQNRIQSRIAAERSDAQKNKQSIFEYQQNIKKLKDQIQKLNNRDSGYDRNDRVKGYRDQIERHNRDKSGYEKQCKNSRDNIERLRNQIEGIRGQHGRWRSQYDQQDRKCRDFDSQIADYQAKIRQLKQRRQQSSKRRQGHQNRFADYERRINQCNQQINNHQNFIREYQEKTKRCDDNIRDFSKKIDDDDREYQRFGRENAQQKRNKIITLEQQIADANRQAQRLVRLYTELQRYQSQFEGTINKHYYGCYQYAPINDNRDNRDDKYTAPSSAFLAYLKEVYGQVPSENIRARFSGSVNIKKHTIFSPSWTKVYGIPYTAGYGSNKDISQDNFSCTEDPINLKVYSGRVQQVTKNVIQVIARSGERFTVHLGGCTRIESALDKELPERGAQVYFKGIQRKDKNHFNGHHITCY